jgi:hypothetical protein
MALARTSAKSWRACDIRQNRPRPEPQRERPLDPQESIHIPGTRALSCFRR